MKTLIKPRKSKAMEAKYKEGEIVFERIRPMQKLMIKRRVGTIYYCVALDQLFKKQLVFFERDLTI